MTPPERRYPTAEKIVLAFIIAPRKLRHYFQSHPIRVVTNYNLRALLYKPDLAGRTANWVMELSQFDWDTIPRTAIKAQVLADVVAHFQEEVQIQEEPSPGWILFTDGSSTVKGCGIAMVLKEAGEKSFCHGRALGFSTLNKEAKYEALIMGLNFALIYGVRYLEAWCDSQLIVCQITGEFEAKETRMKSYLQVVKNMIGCLEKVDFYAH